MQATGNGEAPAVEAPEGCVLYCFIDLRSVVTEAKQQRRDST
jgi:hypothetical protein